MCTELELWEYLTYILYIRILFFPLRIYLIYFCTCIRDGFGPGFDRKVDIVTSLVALYPCHSGIRILKLLANSEARNGRCSLLFFYLS